MRADMSDQEKWNWACGVLGVNSSTPLSDVKRQYHQQALQYHPDKHSGFEEQFKAVQNAYEILTNEKMRQTMLSRTQPVSAPRKHNPETHAPNMKRSEDSFSAKPAWTDSTVKTVLAESRSREFAVSVVKEAKPHGKTSYWIEVDDLSCPDREISGIAYPFFNKEFLERRELSEGDLASLFKSVTDFLVKKIDENKAEMESENKAEMESPGDISDCLDSDCLKGFMSDIKNEITQSKPINIIVEQFANFWENHVEKFEILSESTDEGTMTGFDTIGQNEIAPGLATLSHAGMKLYENLQKQVQDLAKKIINAKPSDKNIDMWRQKMDVSKIMMHDLQHNNQTLHSANQIRTDYPRAFASTIGKSDTEKLFERYLDVRQTVKPGLVETAWNRGVAKPKPPAAEDRDREGEGGKGPRE
ncbi:MAG: hypothetical protein ACD_70C00036G0005 [uncultured bacterium]|nr:MAG: hypothetical protein ACD_70C00036G0005 [uncultured bacterium]OGT25393.1 MAG: hypothetical protein A3B71_04910 [Gammaproteobacteria bacterium RIFCSPHIGHO2_02_FULL_42_43]OGT28695.1 MAG: hypothetical protein A2624_00660 [Gammaproteobacteria bacterium RIFCSPHIGHO2_01_FULL_42_8]OGT51344.1 MAG: hypothetical protein A3E54_04675 [Gammaproteobacteria bacterium RIFCSPHIGHO2_12_FULL_41_25]OGT62046.1 MAG: hypothetical protein A3I77_03605 [Gammaproteobacteria bacterium RIFCSPLOWO2_02_FULL_42_14]OGT